MTEQFEGEQFDGEQFDGSLGDETVRLLSAVQGWASRMFPESAAEHAGGTCQWCPICQFVAVLRGERPEVTDRVVEAGTALMSAFRAFVDATVQGGPTVAPRPNAGEAGSARPRVQRIDLGRPSAPRPRPYPDEGA